ncbi:FAD-binding oxidoreductase [Compostibacter hankyongensis]|uniref:FAD-dependent oxidoreductase n=1 Tax=Compostibacter hankyongensis TaxID=1007089 RepID=A0ABP8FZF3_9BACT
MQPDYLIIGQGICGTLLSYYLLKAGASVLVIDESRPFTASKVASGLINPVTGKRYVTSWMTEELLPAADETYRELEAHLSLSLLSTCEILDFFPAAEAKDSFTRRVAESPYLQLADNEQPCQEYFRFDHGLGRIASCRLLDLRALLQAWRKYLKKENLLRETAFEWEDCTVQPGEVIYKDIRARKIICCEGTAGYDNPYFSRLPYSQSKGEALIASIPELPRTQVYRQGIKILPWGDDSFWIGSSYAWTFSDTHPTPAFRQQVERQLQHWLKLPYRITDHLAGTRPATAEYRPFAGLHPRAPEVGILNGMGSKGCSLAPWLARKFSDRLLQEQPLPPAADIARFSRILSKS